MHNNLGIEDHWALPPVGIPVDPMDQLGFGELFEWFGFPGAMKGFHCLLSESVGDANFGSIGLERAAGEPTIISVGSNHFGDNRFVGLAGPIAFEHDSAAGRGL